LMFLEKMARILIEINVFLQENLNDFLPIFRFFEIKLEIRIFFIFFLIKPLENP